MLDNLSEADILRYIERANNTKEKILATITEQKMELDDIELALGNAIYELAQKNPYKAIELGADVEDVRYICDFWDIEFNG